MRISTMAWLFAIALLLALPVQAQVGPAITQNPTDQTVNAGQTATFTAAASGLPTPTVQWQFSTNGGATFQNVAGAITATLTVPNVTAGQNGTKFRAVFTNASGTATTTAATMTVGPLHLSVDDGFAFASYNTSITYTVGLNNAGGSVINNLDVSSTLSAGLNGATASFSCVLAAGGASCPPNGSGPLAASFVSLPAGASLTWIVDVPVVVGTTATSVTMNVSVSGGSIANVGDTDQLVLFRDGFEATSDVAGIDTSQ